MPKTIAFVPVRGGSKSIPLKNIKELAGKPLVYWMLNALQGANCIDEIVVATDSDEIKSTVNAFNMSKITVYDRDPENAGDTASTESVMLEYIYKAGLGNDDVFVLAQATSPLTKAVHVDEAFELYKESGKDSLLTCVRTKRFYWQDTGEPLNYDYRNRPRRQDFDGLLMENGAFYINSVKNIIKDQNRLSGDIVIYEMPEETAIEIDEESDWIVVENFLKHII